MCLCIQDRGGGAGSALAAHSWAQVGGVRPALLRPLMESQALHFCTCIAQRPLDAFARGMMIGMHKAGMKREEMVSHVSKEDGIESVPLATIDQVIGKYKANPKLRGEEVPWGDASSRWYRRLTLF